ncbi:hypothetical protein AEQU2_01124 [Aequorivita lipolytica]|nr:hypothetical protein AEQU2_01124 [Aequorivita lipolytica]
MFVAQATSGGEGPPPPSQNRPPQLPIDDNIWILIAVGVLFGIYIIYRRNRSTSKAA